MRRPQWVRRPISSKPNTCPETADVDTTGISVKVTRITLGDLFFCRRLLISRDIKMGKQKLADAIVDELSLIEGLNMLDSVKIN